MTGLARSARIRRQTQTSCGDRRRSFVGRTSHRLQPNRASMPGGSPELTSATHQHHSAVAPKNRQLVDASLRRDHNRFLLRQCINANGHCFGPQCRHCPACSNTNHRRASVRQKRSISSGVSSQPLKHSSAIVSRRSTANLLRSRSSESSCSITIPTAACDMRRLLLNTARRDSNIHATRAEVPARPNCGDRRNASRSAVRWRTSCAITHTAFRIRTRDTRRMKGVCYGTACLRCCGRWESRAGRT